MNWMARLGSQHTLLSRLESCQAGVQKSRGLAPPSTPLLPFSLIG